MSDSDAKWHCRIVVTTSEGVTSNDNWIVEAADPWDAVNQALALTLADEKDIDAVFVHEPVKENS